MKLKTLLPLLLTFVFFQSVFVSAQTDEFKVDIEIISFEELMNMLVTTASKKAESVNEAPGIISVISKKEIEGFAAKTLGDVLNRVVGSIHLSANVFTNNLISLRGQETTPYNNHILILLNGRPLRDPITGGLNNIIYTGFPLNLIERIEVIRGPGSVLYGSCAYSGVINIITKLAENDGSSYQADLIYGSNNTFAQSFTGIIKEGDLQLSFSGLNHSEKGPKYEFIDYLNINSNANFERKNFSFVSNLSYKGLKINQMYSQYNPYGLAGADNNWDLTTDPFDNNLHKIFLLDMGYSHPFSEIWTTEANVNFTQRNWTTDGFIDNSGKDIMFELLNRISPSENLNILIGATYTDTDYRGGLLINNNLWSGSIYSQIDYRLIEELKLIGGFQYNKIQGIDGNLSPRLGVVANLNKNLGLKVLYSQAFRKGYPLETSFDVIVFKGNLELKPELINTFETQLFYQSEKIQASFTYYNSVMKDIIYRQRFVDPTVPPLGWYLKYINGGEHKFWGIEFETKVSLLDNLMFVGSYAYQTNENENGVENATLHPQNYLKIGLLYQDAFITAGIFNSYFSEPNKVIKLNPSVNIYNKEAEAFNLLSAKIGVDLFKLFNFQSTKKMILSIEWDNLLNKDVRYPEYTSRGVNTLLPLYEGSEFLVGIKYNF